MDVEQFSIDNTPSKRDKREDYGLLIYDEIYCDDKIPKFSIPKEKKVILCCIKEEYEDDTYYDLQPSGVIHPHGCPHDTMNSLIDIFPEAAIKKLRELYPRYTCKHKSLTERK